MLMRLECNFLRSLVVCFRMRFHIISDSMRSVTADTTTVTEIVKSRVPVLNTLGPRDNFGRIISKGRDAELLDILSRRWDVHILIPFRRYCLARYRYRSKIPRCGDTASWSGTYFEGKQIP
jgi:hypothetical protein